MSMVYKYEKDNDMGNIYKEVSGEGKDVVVIHGGCASHLDMAPVVKALASCYKVTCVDTPGTGESLWDESIKDIHDIADCLLKELPEKAIYVGWSFGGLIAQSIAARHPSRMKHLIGLMTTPKFIAAEDWPGFPQPGYGALVFPILEEGKESKDFLKMFYEEEFLKINPKPKVYKEVEKLWNHPSMIKNDMIKKVLTICDNTDLRDFFKLVRCPIDFIMGDQDPNIPKEAFEKIQLLNPSVNIHVIHGGAHAPFWTHQKEFNLILNRIMKNT